MKEGILVKFYLLQPSAELKFRFIDREVNNEATEGFKPEDYELVYCEERMRIEVDPEEDFINFNDDFPRPFNYYGTSVSTNDIFVYIYNNKVEVYKVDKIGFTYLDNFLNNSLLSKIINNYDVNVEYTDLITNSKEESKDRIKFLKDNYLAPISLAVIRRLADSNKDLLDFISPTIATNEGKYFLFHTDFLDKYRIDYEDALMCFFDIQGIQNAILIEYCKKRYINMSKQERKDFLKKYKDKNLDSMDLNYKELYIITMLKEIIKEKKK